MLEEFVFGDSSELEEVLAELDLLFVGLVVALSDDLLYGVLLFALFVLAKPHQGETSTA